MDLDTILMDPNLKGYTWDFDIDNDSENDLRVVSEVLDSTFILYWPGFSIQSLHPEFGFSGESRSDSIYKSIEIKIENNDNGEVVKRTNTYYNCVKMSPGDQIHSINKNSLILDTYSKGEHLDSLSDFISGSLLLNKMYAYAPREDIVSEDTLFYNSMNFRNECSVFPENELIYIVFELQQKLGWIKLGLIGNDFLLIDKVAIEE